MKPKRYIEKFYDLIHGLNIEGHINSTNKGDAVMDIETAVHKLRKAFEYAGEMESDKPSDT